MGNLNSFPLVLSIKSGSGIQSELSKFESNLRSSANRASASLKEAGRAADGAFRFDGARRQVQELAREIDTFRNRQAAKRADLFGIQSALQGLSADPFNRVAAEILASENRLAAQRARAHAENMANLAAQAQAGISAVQARQAAQTEAFRQAEAEGLRLLQLDQQRIAESAKMAAGPQFVASPSFNPAGFIQAAAAADKFAAEQRALANAANIAANAVDGATAEQRAFAVAANQAADAAEAEASRLRALATAQGNVAASAEAAGIKLVQSSDLVTNSVRGQRFAFIQSSQQVQDFLIQIQGGQNPMIAFSQQASQLAFVMAGAGGEAGKFARFIAGGWGTLIFSGLTVLSLLTAGLFDNSKAHQEAEKAAKAFGDRQKDIKNFIDETTGALIEQNKTLIQNAILTRQARLLANKDDIADGQKKAFEAARTAAAGGALAKYAGQLTDVGGVGPVQRNAGVDRVIQQAGNDVDKLSAGLFKLAQTNPALKDVALQVSELGSKAILATRENQRLNDELAALNGKGDKIFTPAALQGAVAIAAATDKYAKKIAELNEQKRRLDASVTNKTFKGDRDDYVQQAAAIEKQITLTKKAESDAKKAASAGRSAAKQAATDRRQELFADAQAIADGTDAIKAANSGYAAQITRLKNQLKEGLISSEDAKAQAIAARQIRNAAVEAAQAQKKLGEALAQGEQRFDGESTFVDQIQTFEAAIASARKQIDELGVAMVNGTEYTGQRLDDLSSKANAAFLKPITDANRQLREQAEIDKLILAGREGEAQALQSRYQLLSQYGTLGEKELARLEKELGINKDLIDAEQQRTREIERRNQLIQVQVQQARQLQSAFEDFLTDPFKKGSLSNLTKAITEGRKRAIAQELSIKLFGDLGQSVEDRLRRGGEAVATAGANLDKSATALTNTADGALEAFQSAAGALTGSAESISQAAGTLRGANDNIPTLGQVSTTPTAFGQNVGNAAGEALAEIVVTGHRYRGAEQTGLEPFLTDFSKDLKQIDVNLGRSGGSSVGSTIAGLVNGLGGIETVLSFASSAIGGKGGNAINGLLGMAAFNQLGKAAFSSILKAGGGTFAAAGIGQTVGAGIAGIGQGMFADSLVKLLGLKGSKTGGAIGGAIGGAAFGPIGGFIGGALGSIVGGMLKKTPYATSSFTTANGQLVAGNNQGNKASASTASKASRGAVVEGLNAVLEQFGATISGDPGVTVGNYDGKYRVSTTGYKGKLDFKGSSANGLHSFADAESAVKFAIQAIIEKGAIAGIRESTKRLLAAGTDLDKQIQKALTFENVFTELKSYTDPVGAAIDALDKKFAGLRSIFEEASASTEEYSKLEQLYAIQRSEAVEQAAKSITGTLQGFLDNLRYSGETGLSLRTREANARSAFSPLAAQIMGGQRVDQDKFTETAQSYLDIAREIYGSTQQYFDLLNRVTNLTAKAITNAGGTVTPITAANTATNIATATGTTTSAAGASSIGYASVAGATPVTGASYDMVKQIANDNAALSATIVEQFKQQTAAVAIPADRLAWFSRGDTVSAIQEAMRPAATPGGAGGTGSNAITAPDVVAALGRIDQKMGKLVDASTIDQSPPSVLVSPIKPATTVKPSPLLGTLRTA